MTNPEKDRELETNKEPAPRIEKPKLDAILPDTPPSSSAELVGDLDDYQRRLEREWDKAKINYEENINRIMGDFMTEGMANLKKTASDDLALPTRSPAKHSKSLFKEVEDELKRIETPPKIPYFGIDKPHFGFSRQRRIFIQPSRKELKMLIFLGVLLAGSFLHFYLNSVTSISLPYTHTLGPILTKDKIYVMDWFRKSLFIHDRSKNLTISAVEYLPNELATGIAISDKIVWSLDSFNAKIHLHNTTPDHQIQQSIPTPEGKPVGLFFDGVDIWSADQNSKQLFRHRGNDLEDIKESFLLPDINITAFGFFKSRFWVLDSKSRLLKVFRLQNPMREMNSYDLDPFLKGSSPTGFSIEGRRLYLVTENPATLITVPLYKLKKAR